MIDVEISIGVYWTDSRVDATHAISIPDTRSALFRGASSDRAFVKMRRFFLPFFFIATVVSQEAVHFSLFPGINIVLARMILGFDNETRTAMEIETRAWRLSSGRRYRFLPFYFTLFFFRSLINGQPPRLWRFKVTREPGLYFIPRELQPAGRKADATKVTLQLMSSRRFIVRNTTGAPGFYVDLRFLSKNNR